MIGLTHADTVTATSMKSVIGTASRLTAAIGATVPTTAICMTIGGTRATNMTIITTMVLVRTSRTLTGTIIVMMTGLRGSAHDTHAQTKTTFTIGTISQATGDSTRNQRCSPGTALTNRSHLLAAIVARDDTITNSIREGT